MKLEDILIRQQDAVAAVAAASDLASLEALRIQNLGRNGLIQDIMAALKTAEPAQKRELGLRPGAQPS